MGAEHQGVIYQVTRTVVTAFLRATTRHTLVDAHKIPATGGVIIASNHISHSDPLTLGIFLHQCGRPPRFMGKSDLWSIPLVRSVLVHTGQIPVRRNTVDASASLSDAVEALRQGECLVIYPEGTLTKDPARWPMVARTGVARLALATGAPVIPVGQWGPQHMRHNLIRRPWRRTRVQIVVGDPVDLSAFAGVEPSAEVLAEVTASVMARIRLLVGRLRGVDPPTEIYDHRAPRRLAPLRQSVTDETSDPSERASA